MGNRPLRWNRGIGVPLILPLPATHPHLNRAAVVRHLKEGLQKIDGGDYDGAAAASRKALELMRDMSVATKPIPRVVKDQDIDQRVLVVIDSLFALASAPPHVTGAVRNFQPSRSDSVAVIGATAAIAEELFARLGD